MRKIKEFLRRFRKENRLIDRAETERPRPHYQIPAAQIARWKLYSQQLEEEMAEKTFESEVMAALAAQSTLLNTMSNALASVPNILTQINTTLQTLPQAGGETGTTPVAGPSNADVLEAVNTVGTAVTAAAANVVEALATLTKIAEEVTPPDDTTAGADASAKQG